MTKQVEVVYQPPTGRLFHSEISFEVGMTVQDVIDRSNIYHQFPDLSIFSIGIFSKKVTLETFVQPGDRIEIYRPLICNPKDRRRLKAILNKK